MHLVQLANPREQLLLWFCQVTLEIYVKLVSSKPFQKHLNAISPYALAALLSTDLFVAPTFLF